MSTENFSGAYHRKALVGLGVPIVVGQVGNIVLGFADTIMVGRHSMTELAAASFVNTLFALAVIFAMGYSYGLTPVVGKMFGEGRPADIGPVVRNGLAANLALALLVVAALSGLYAGIHLLGQPVELLPLMRPYLLVNIVSLPFICLANTFKQFFDAIGHTKTPMYILLAGNVVNIFGNYVLIYGAFGMPELGLLGAGVSTLFSRVVMAALFVGVFFGVRRYSVYSGGFLRGRFDRAMFLRLNSLGWPLALQMGMECAAFSLTAVMVGWIGTTALAAHQIMITVSQLFYMVYYGLGAAVAVRVSYFNGQRDYAAIGGVTRAGFLLIMLIAAVVAVPIFFIRGSISLLFTDDAEVCLLVAQTVIVLILYQFGDGLQCNYANAMRGLGSVRPMMWISFFSYFIVSLPLSWLLGIRLGFGLVGVWSAFPVCLTVAGVLYYIGYRRSLAAATVNPAL